MGTSISFSHPAYLILGAAAAVFLLLLWRRRTGFYRPIPFPLWAWRDEVRRAHSWRRTFVHFLRPLALLLLAFVAAGPSAPSEEPSPVPAEATVVLLDVSSTMTATDFPGARLGAVKSALRRLVERSPGAEFGLVVFASMPEVVVPPTADRAAFLEQLERVTPAAFGEDGTAIGSAVASGIDRIGQATAGAQRLLLITDGINNRGAVSPRDAAALARLRGIRVNVVALGGDLPARFRVPLENGGTEEVEARLEIDEDVLREVSRETGGAYFRVRESAELGPALERLIPSVPGDAGRVRTFLGARAARLAALIAVLLMTAELAAGALLAPDSPL